LDTRELGIAVVGSGRIGSLRARMAAGHPAVKFLAVSDLDADRADRLAKSAGADFSSGDNTDVIAHPRVNAVIVSTSEHEHLEPVMQALELGKPVLVEKPIALTLADADRIIAKAEATGTSIRVGYAQRFKRRYLSAKDQILEGRLGEITALTGRACNTRAQGIEILKRSATATPVVDVLTYWVDVARGSNFRRHSCPRQRRGTGISATIGDRLRMSRACGLIICRATDLARWRPLARRARRWRSPSPSKNRHAPARPCDWRISTTAYCSNAAVCWKSTRCAPGFPPAVRQRTITN
jgi:hypothetical protein